ncbi:shikimate kinase [Gryllotalpicola protaetiae]|uniref:Shikimate kinase n=1 Tax=Gryllotalpicola protaetiae TaxID=2419771 RepID=A0A387BL87_9MICO|nr:shikimate kinase [Gryllotalpicola protaetiae]AYG04945.1 shikimate kinase [Gryllotalpicola protaetiae]
MAIVLIGPPAAGKSKVGKKLARLLDKDFVDTDAIVVRDHGPITEIFAEHGEPYFRRLERAAVIEALAQDAIISFGGGAVLDEDTQRDLEAHVVVLLDVDPEHVEGRITADGKRPLAPDLESWKALVAARRPLYERLADRRVETANRPRDQIAADLAVWIRSGKEFSE